LKLADHLEFAFSNLWKSKLRTFLTTFGVTIGIGALVAMLSFGRGMQKNVTESFRTLELFNSITVLPGGFMADRGGRDPDERGARRAPSAQPSGQVQRVLDDKAVEKIAGLKGVETVFPEVRIPALVNFNGKQEFRLIQVIPAKVAGSNLVKYRAGKAYSSDDEKSLIISTSLLRQFDIRDPQSALGKTVIISSIAFDLSILNPLDLAAALRGEKLPFSKENYELTVAGVTESMGFGGPSPIQSDIFIPPQTAQKMKRLPFSSIWDLFRAREGRLGYSALNVRLSSPRFVEPVKKEIQAMGFETFALADQFQEIQRGFIILDMILLAIGMIAIVVASLGIINTMVMSILERYNEIGIMKAVGGSDGDIKKIFFFESSAIGLLGGFFGLALGWVTSGLINRIVNYFLAKQGVPYINYFSFPLWICIGAVAFSVSVSLVSGIYPAWRAARVDPVRALRHDSKAKRI
jgi:putative ABC transport system permease protein